MRGGILGAHRAVAEEDAVRRQLKYLLSGIARGNNGDAAVVRRQAAHDVVLDAKVVRHHLRRWAGSPPAM